MKIVPFLTLCHMYGFVVVVGGVLFSSNLNLNCSWWCILEHSVSPVVPSSSCCNWLCSVHSRMGTSLSIFPSVLVTYAKFLVNNLKAQTGILLSLTFLKSWVEVSYMSPKDCTIFLMRFRHFGAWRIWCCQDEVVRDLLTWMVISVLARRQIHTWV